MSDHTYRFKAAEGLNYVVCFNGGIARLVEDDYGIKTKIGVPPGATLDDMFLNLIKARTSRGVTEATIRRAARFLEALQKGFVFEAAALLSEAVRGHEAA